VGFIKEEEMLEETFWEYYRKLSDDRLKKEIAEEALAKIFKAYLTPTQMENFVRWFANYLVCYDLIKEEE